MAMTSKSAPMTDTDQYVSFSDWFNEPEGYALRSERFDGDVEWLKAAFAAGQSCPQPLSASPKGDDLEPVADNPDVEITGIGRDGHTEWLENYMRMKSRAETAEAENATLKREIAELRERLAELAESFAGGTDYNLEPESAVAESVTAKAIASAIRTLGDTQ